MLPQMYHLPLSLYLAFLARCFVAGEMLSGACYHPTPRARLAELLLRCLCEAQRGLSLPSTYVGAGSARTSQTPALHSFQQLLLSIVETDGRVCLNIT